MLNYILKTPGGDTSFIRPNTPGLVYIALFTDPDGLTSSSLETNQGTGAVIPYEVTGGGYNRQQIYFNDSATGGLISNSTEIVWGRSTAPWGTVTHYALLNIGVSDFPGTLFWGVFDTPIEVRADDRFYIRTGQLKIRMN